MKGECEMGFDFRGSKERVSLSFTAENECRCERISCVCLCVCVCVCVRRVCYMALVVPIISKACLCTVFIEGTSKPIARKSTPQSSSVLNASES